MDNYYKKEEHEKESVNDDLDFLFEAIRLGKELDGTVNTYFLPMLTENELELVEQKNSNYLKKFRRANVDVEEAEMKLSKSKSKFVYSWGVRRTVTIDPKYINKIIQESTSAAIETQNS